MKRLYIVRNARTRVAVSSDGKPLYFSSKAVAKATRNALMIETGENFVVSRGPDYAKKEREVGAIADD